MVCVCVSRHSSVCVYRSIRIVFFTHQQHHLQIICKSMWVTLLAFYSLSKRSYFEAGKLASSFDVIGGHRDRASGDLAGWKDCLRTNQKDFLGMNLTSGRECLDSECRKEFPPVLVSDWVYAMSASGFHFLMMATSCGQKEELGIFQGAAASCGCSDAEEVIVR